MKRFLALILALVLFVTPMASCKKTPTDEDNGGSGDGDKDQTTDTGKPEEKPEDEPELPGVDFLSDDLSDYIEIDEKYYKGYTVEIDPDRVSSFEVENEIIKILYKYKSTDPIEGDGVISVGDTVDIYYKGYYMKDGERVYFSGGDNTSSPKPHSLGIGSGGFIPGFEYNLIGKNPADYEEGEPIVVETFFPENYQAAELAGKTAYFEVTVVKNTEYSVPEFNDAFITEVLKVTAESLFDYEGETLADKYRSYVKEKIMIDNGLDVDTLVQNAFWDVAMGGAVVKKYPERELKNSYDALIEELEYYYGYYSRYYSYGYDEFMRLYLGLDPDADWKAYVMDIAENQVKQQLIFYHIMNLEGLKPTEQEYADLFDDYVTKALENNGITPDKYESEEAYLAAKAEYKEKIIAKNGEDYYRTMVYYEIVMDAIISYANIVEKAD